MYAEHEAAMAQAINDPMSRRHFLWKNGVGLGGLALTCMLQEEAAANENRSITQGIHFPARAKRVVQIFCMGGMSQIDTFDHKPALEKFHGKKLQGRGELRGFFGQAGLIMKSPFQFKRYGKSGSWVSSILPNLATCVDECCFLHSMVAKSNNHTPATFQMNTGFTLNGFPCMGSWLSYGLGTENNNLPSFVTLPDPRGLPAGGSINWAAGFLPAAHQGVAFNTSGSELVRDLRTPSGVSAAKRTAGLDFLENMNRRFLEENPGNSELAARLRSYELAGAMQLSIPEAQDFSKESDEIKKLYGIENTASEGIGRNCLIARRLLERGVRFVQIINGGAFGSPRINWDAHESVVKNHTKMAASMDQPFAGLIKDLNQRGMLDDTLVLLTTEFGRGPATQGVNRPGRDHHPDAFTFFMAGAGLKKGFHYGESDDIGFAIADKPTTIHDFHATVLHLMGIDHKKLTYYHNGIQRRLTDVHGHVIKGIIA